MPPKAPIMVPIVNDFGIGYNTLKRDQSRNKCFDNESDVGFEFGVNERVARLRGLM
jgi:hypothetical protein